ncbi:hypothetical protein D9Q98_000625 [Chlorella vulgaris]|uniref:Uncharacterized protein n=1 Tax=Chlorella vulgaris TaxID=3077 RepID=A0A9D4Z1C2_CHLVU|nr:hypothetical protein D9Q98_000625 [Chlorella vulgaris]
MGAKVLRHIAAIDSDADLKDAVHILPVTINAPQPWHTLTAGVEANVLALRSSLSPRRYPIPRFSTLPQSACQLACSSDGRRFRARAVNLFLALLFEQIPAAVALAGLPPVSLDRWDLHHGHLFYASSCRQLGILLHAKEYPAVHSEFFDVNLGNCQAGSSLEFTAEGMDHRNLVWIGGRLACLEMSAASPLRPLLMPGLELPRTVQESDLGQPLADLNYFAELSNRKPSERLFVCVPGD